MLNSKYFKQLHVQTHLDTVYTGYELLNHPIVLYSQESGEPLASLSVVFSDESNYASGTCFITELSNSNPLDQRFQVVSTKNDVEVAFVITNFCDNFINFNLMAQNNVYDGGLVKEVNPGGLNQINELMKFQTYVVKSDQTNDNRTIILKKHISLTGEQVKLEDELKNEKDNKVTTGTYIFPRIVPIKNEKLSNKFKNTIWRATDYIVLKSASPKPPVAIKHRGLSFGGGLTRSVSSRVNGLDDIIDKNLVRNHFFESNTREMSGLELLCDRTEELSLSSTDFRRTKCAKKNIDSNSKKSFTQSDLMKSSVANINHGKKIEVESFETGIDYDYDNQSCTIKFGMSIMEELCLYPSRSSTEIKQDVIEFIKQLVENIDKNLLEGLKVYKVDETCCVCLEEKANTVFFRCGHQCTDTNCSKQLNKCPLCRAIILTKIDQ